MMSRVLGIAASVLMLGLSLGAAQETPEAGHAPDVNDMAPDFELKDSTGKTHRLSELRGKNVILEFIRSGSW